MSSALLVAVLVAVLVGIQVSDSIATEAESFAEHDVPAYQLLLSIDRDGYETQLRGDTGHLVGQGGDSGPRGTGGGRLSAPVPA